MLHLHLEEEKRDDLHIPSFPNGIRTGFRIGNHPEGALVLPKHQFVLRIKQGSGVGYMKVKRSKPDLWI